MARLPGAGRAVSGSKPSLTPWRDGPPGRLNVPLSHVSRLLICRWALRDVQARRPYAKLKNMRVYTKEAAPACLAPVAAPGGVLALQMLSGR